MPRYKTTRPVIPLATDRKVIEAVVNDRLTVQLRRYELSDLEHVHRLRTQERVMINTSTGVIDANLEASQRWMNRALPPNDKNNFNLMIWIQEKGQPWEHIGSMGCHILVPVPHIGYMIREEWWGKSVATAAVRAFLKAYWNLERTVVELTTDDFTDEHELHLLNLEINQNPVSGAVESEVDDGCRVVPEILLAEIEENNVGSVRVIEKCGFQYRDRESVVEATGTFILLDYTLSRSIIR